MKTDYEIISELLECDTETGLFKWKIRRSNHCARGWFGGADHGDGYKVIRINNQLYRSHRIIWLMTHKMWPKNQIDHIDNDVSNNKISNLREATGCQNKQNRKINKNTTSQIKGIMQNPYTKKWIARVSVNGKRKNLGHFHWLHHAKEAIEKFRVEHHGEFANHG